MIGETILARTSARCLCKQTYNSRDNINLIIGLQSAFWWSVNIYCANYWPTIGAPIIVPPILARLSAVFFNSANPTWGCRFIRSPIGCRKRLKLMVFDKQLQLMNQTMSLTVYMYCNSWPFRKVNQTRQFFLWWKEEAVIIFSCSFDFPRKSG